MSVGFPFTAYLPSIEYSQILTPTHRIHLATAEAIAVLGATHAPLSPAAHLRTFIWTDIASLCIQSLGLSLTFSGARAAGPWGLMLPARAHTGQTILFAGLLLHTLSLAASLVVLAVTYVRAAARANSGSNNNNYNDKHAYTSTTTTTTRASLITALSPRCKLFLAALPLAAACVLVRCAYRAAAAWGGLGSPIARDQLLWLVAEGALLTEAMVSLAAFHPALCLCLDGGNERTQDLEAGRSGGIMGDDDNNKRYSAAGAISKTTLSTTSSSPERGEMRMMQQHEEEGDAAEAMLAHEGSSRVMFSSNVMMAPPSDAGSSSSSEEEALWSRAHARASVGTVLDADPYYRYEDPFATPQEEEEDEGHSPYNGRFFEDAADDHIALPGSRDNNNTAEEDRFETESFVEPPRKSSKRLSRALSPPSSAAITAQEGYLAAEAEGLMGSPSRSGSVVLSPPRKSSKRLSQQQQPAAPVRGLSVRTEEEDRLEVASIMLPSRKPSKMSTMHGGEDLDAVSLYSQ